MIKIILILSGDSNSHDERETQRVVHNSTIEGNLSIFNYMIIYYKFLHFSALIQLMGINQNNAIVLMTDEFGQVINFFKTTNLII